jgi:hypothetical protein
MTSGEFHQLIALLQGQFTQIDRRLGQVLGQFDEISRRLDRLQEVTTLRERLEELERRVRE